jgi:hypothetical protein
MALLVGTLLSIALLGRQSKSANDDGLKLLNHWGAAMENRSRDYPHITRKIRRQSCI